MTLLIFFIFLIKKKNIGLWNLTKVINLWKNLFTLLNNIFFFNLKYILFSTLFFKKELLYLIYYKNLFFKKFLRYTNSFIFFINNKNFVNMSFYFKYLLTHKYIVSFIIDLNYHKNTLFLLNKFKFLTIGPVPISSNIYLLNISFPIPSNSNYSNYFFIRNIIYIKKNLTKLKYIRYYYI